MDQLQRPEECTLEKEKPTEQVIAGTFYDHHTR
jgi:hypothetical protein